MDYGKETLNNTLLFRRLYQQWTAMEVIVEVILLAGDVMEVIQEAIIPVGVVLEVNQEAILRAGDAMEVSQEVILLVGGVLVINQGDQHPAGDVKVVNKVVNAKALIKGNVDTNATNQNTSSQNKCLIM